MDVAKLLTELKSWAESEQPINHVVQGMNQVKGSMEVRIFNSEAGARDVSGNGLGSYSNAYAKFRQSKGRQVKVVDLELTGSLRRDIKVVRSGTTVTCVVPSTEERKKIGYLEAQYNKNIFDFSPAEQEELDEVIKINISQDISDILNGIK
jgi:hypothetical protein